MSKMMDELRRNGNSNPANNNPTPTGGTGGSKDFETLMAELEKRLEPVKKLKDLDPETLKAVQEKMISYGKTITSHSEELEKHDKVLEAHEGRLTKLEKNMTTASPAPAVMPGVAARTVPVAVQESDYDKLYPKDPVPHHVVPAFYVRLSTGKQILRYLEADAIRIANTEEFGFGHTALAVDAWADAEGLLIRPLSAEESEKYRKMAR